MSDTDRYWFENVPEEKRFYFLVQYVEYEPERGSVVGLDHEFKEMLRRQHKVGFLPQALNYPVWSTVEDRPDPYTPRIFTRKELAEERLRFHNDPDVELQAYEQLVDELGEADVNEAYDNSAPLRVVWTTREMLLDALEDAEFTHLMVDSQVVSRRGLMKKLAEEE